MTAHTSCTRLLPSVTLCLASLAFWSGHLILSLCAGLQLSAVNLLTGYIPYVIGSALLLHWAPRLSRFASHRFWLVSATAVLGLSTAHAGISMDAHESLGDVLAISALAYIFPYAAILGTAVSLHQRRTARLREQEHVSAQLQALRARLQPHFLFNALQAIGTTAPRDGALAARMITMLGDLLRQSLNERDGMLVSLAQEQALLAPYLQLQQLRFSDRLRVEFDMPAELLGAAVPDLLLQPLVENALQHGIEQRPGAGTVRITARRRADQLWLAVDDDGRGLPPSHEAKPLGTGLGSTKKRLEVLYGGRASLKLQHNEHGGTSAIVCLPYQEVRCAA